MRAVATARQRCSGSSSDIPSTLISPWLGGMRPVIRFISVVLPLPLGPTRLVTPGGMVRLTLLTPTGKTGRFLVGSYHAGVNLR